MLSEDEVSAGGKVKDIYYRNAMGNVFLVAHNGRTLSPGTSLSCRISRSYMDVEGTVILDRK